MSGVAIITALLQADQPLAGFLSTRSPPLQAATQIKGGRLPDGIVLPAFLVRTVSVVERQMLERGALVRTVERVSVAVRAASYRDQRAAIGLVRTACAGRVGTLAGFDRASVLTAGTGPDATGPGDSFEQTQDFRVSFDAQG